jgi:hypothetical protein
MEVTERSIFGSVPVVNLGTDPNSGTVPELQAAARIASQGASEHAAHKATI